MGNVDVDAVDYASAAADLHAVRHAVFVLEQDVPAELERDAADPACLHVLARDAAGTPIGAARLVPPFVAVNGCTGVDGGEQAHHPHAPHDPLPRIGRMAVLGPWRKRGVGEAMVAALETLARQRGWPVLALNAQASAIGFYMRLGYLPDGPRFHEAGIEHQAMQRRLDGGVGIETRDAAVATVTALAHRARRQLRIYSRALDPGLFDAPEVLDALRRLAVRGGGMQIRVLLHDATTPQRDQAPLIALAQRLPSVIQLRQVDDPVDHAYPSAFVANDAGGYYFRALGHRFDGDADLDAPGRARQLCVGFDQTWERSLPCSQLRALGI